MIVVSLFRKCRPVLSIVYDALKPGHPCFCKDDIHRSVAAENSTPSLQFIPLPSCGICMVVIRGKRQPHRHVFTFAPNLALSSARPTAGQVPGFLRHLLFLLRAGNLPSLRHTGNSSSATTMIVGRRYGCRWQILPLAVVVVPLPSPRFEKLPFLRRPRRCAFSAQDG